MLPTLNNKSLTMSSLEIAELTGKRHDHIIRDIREMIDAARDAPDLGYQLNQGLIEHKDKRGYTSRYDLDRLAAEVLVTGYDVVRRGRVIRRLLELEGLLANETQRANSRAQARIESPVMTNAIKAQREKEGKLVKHYLFSNEFDMINRIALGMTAKQYREHHQLDKADSIRDHLTRYEIECIEHLQRVNSSLIDIGMGYKERKKHLDALYHEHHCDRLMGEVQRLEA